MREPAATDARRGPTEVVAATLAVAGALAWSQPEIPGPDTWWLLASGRLIWETGSVPSVDSFSHTFAGQPWMNHEWLWSLGAWFFYRTNPQLLAVANLFLLGIVFTLVYGGARRASSPAAAVFATWTAAATAHWFIDIRPHLVTLALVAFVLWSRRERWAPWSWPLLMVLWVNLHGGFLFGVGLIGLIVLLRAAEAGVEQRRLVLPMPESLGLALALLAALVNPWGFHVVEYPLSYLEGSSVFREINEWHPPGFGLDPSTFQGRLWWLAIVATAGLPRALGRARVPAAVSLVTLAMALTSRRFIPLFAVTAAPLVALAAEVVIVRVRDRVPVHRRFTARVVVATVAAALVLAWWQGVRLSPHLLQRWTMAALYPNAAVRVLRELAPRRPFHEFNWGGLVTFAAPEIPVFIDGRANTLYDAEITREYLTIERVQPGYLELLDRREIDAVLVGSSHPLIGALSETDPPWSVIYRDALASILLPPGSDLAAHGRPSPDRDAPEVALVRAFRSARRGDEAEAAATLEEIIDRNPLFFPAYGELVFLKARAGDLDAVDATVAAGIEAYPRGWRRFVGYRGRALQLMGRFDEARAQYHRARHRGPFDAEPSMERWVRELP